MSKPKCQNGKNESDENLLKRCNQIFQYFYPPASEASNGISKFNCKKKSVYGVKEFVRLSVVNFVPNYLRIGKTEWAEIF